ncbi:MAG: 30S ribosome-binding factor RbfA [Cytophagales bacterium]
MKESKRQLKFSQLIQEELADIFLKDTKGMFGKVFITITRVLISPDLSVAKVYLSFMLSDDKQKTLSEIKEQTKGIRNLLSARIKKEVRVIPELVFFLDDSAEYAIHISKVISDLNIPPAPTEEK